MPAAGGPGSALLDLFVWGGGTEAAIWADSLSQVASIRTTLLELADTLEDEVLLAGQVFYIICLRATALSLPLVDFVYVSICQFLHRRSMARIRALARAQEATRREATAATSVRRMAEEAHQIREGLPRP